MLWRVYEQKVTTQFNRQRILKNRLKATPKETGEGERIEFPLHIGSSGGITVTNTTTLPNAQYQEYTSGTANYFHLYGQIKVDGPMMSSTVKGKTSFRESLDSETTNMVEDLKDIDQILLWGDGSGLLATVVSTSDDGTTTTITLDTCRNLKRGMVVDVLVKTTGASTVGAVKARIADVDFSGPTCQILSAAFVGGDGSAIDTTYGLYLQGARNTAPWGVQAIVAVGDPGTSATYYGGITRAASNAWWRAQRSHNSAVNRALSLSLVDKLIQNITSRSNGRPNLIMTTPAIEGILGGMLVDSKRYRGDTMTLDGWYKATTFAGIPVVADKHAPANHLWVLDTRFWRRYFPPDIGQGKWFSEDGHVLSRVSQEDAVEAFWKSYFQNICTNPSAQGVLEDISES